jgi:Right handed beta helix region
MNTCLRCVTILSIIACPLQSFSANVSKPLGEPHLERPTLRSLGVYWIIQGDENQNASIRLEYRKEGSSPWQAGAPLFRVERGAHLAEKYGSRIEVPGDGWLFAGSVLLLEPDTAYELKLTLDDPDGGSATRTFKSRTRSEPRVSPQARRRYVVPGTGGGTGRETDPFRGLEAAQKAAAPGDLFLLGPGVYEGTWTIGRSGTPAQPIVWRGRGNGEAIIDGQNPGQGGQRPGQAIAASGSHDVWFEDLTIRNATYGLVFHDSARIVVRRCHVQHVDYGLTATRDTRTAMDDHFIADNLIEGPSTWPRTKGIEDARGIQISGQGHVVCFNRIRGFADAIDTLPSPRCAAIDFHNNDLSELTDDGIEMDYSERNTRCFFNRLTNVFQGISMQPVYGGPVYVFRNVMDNVAVEPFKLHNNPSGCLIVHNTIVKKGTPALLHTPEMVRHVISRNNLYLGTNDHYGMDFLARMTDCDFDYDGFAGGPFQILLRWNGVRYGTLDEVKKKAPVLKHALLLDARTLFASGAQPPDDIARPRATSIDLRLSPRSKAIDAGVPLAGLNDGFRGARPDLGAYELNDPLPHYGPRLPRETTPTH